MGGGKPLFAGMGAQRMRTLLIGLSDISAHAMEMLVTSLLPQAVVIRQSGPFPTLPTGYATPADLFIVDLNGMGFSQWSPARQSYLQQRILRCGHALLLAPVGNGGGWLDASIPGCLVLQQPISTAAVRSALSALNAKEHAPKTAAHPHQGPVSGHTSPAPVLSSAPMPAPCAPTPYAYAMLKDTCPAAFENAFLNLMLDMAVHPGAQEFTISDHWGCVMQPMEGWVACNISTPLRLRLTQHPLMLKLIQVKPLENSKALENARYFYGQRSDGRRPLDTFLWALTFNTLKGISINTKKDLRIHLHKFPNFTRLPAMPDLFIQLALLCMRGPQSIHGLQRLFPSHTHPSIVLFTICAVLSGCATVAASAQDKPIPHQKTNTLPTKPAAPRSFLRALLKKLF